MAFSVLIFVTIEDYKEKKKEQKKDLTELLNNSLDTSIKGYKNYLEEKEDSLKIE